MVDYSDGHNGCHGDRYPQCQKALRILKGDRIERASHRFDQCPRLLACAFSKCLLASAFYLGEGFLYEVEVGRVGRQVEWFAASLFDEFSHPLALVGGRVVHNHDPSTLGVVHSNFSISVG